MTIKVAEVCPTGIVTVLGTVASVVSPLVRVTVNASVVAVLRVMVAVAVPVSLIMFLSRVKFKLGLSLSVTFRLVVACPASMAKFVPV